MRFHSALRIFNLFNIKSFLLFNEHIHSHLLFGLQNKQNKIDINELKTFASKNTKKFLILLWKIPRFRYLFYTVLKYKSRPSNQEHFGYYLSFCVYKFTA